MNKVEKGIFENYLYCLWSLTKSCMMGFLWKVIDSIDTTRDTDMEEHVEEDQVLSHSNKGQFTKFLQRNGIMNMKRQGKLAKQKTSRWHFCLVCFVSTWWADQPTWMSCLSSQNLKSANSPTQGTEKGGIKRHLDWCKVVLFRFFPFFFFCFSSCLPLTSGERMKVNHLAASL